MNLGESPDLPRSTIITYCVPMVGVGFMLMPFSVWLMKFGTDALLIAPAAMGVLFMAARIWDAITDPLVGYWSDRSNAKRGRRRSWMMASAIPVAISVVMLWSPPRVLEGGFLIAWMAIALLAYETAATCFFIPYGALGMELTEKYHERTRLFGYRHVIAAFGSIAGLGAVYVLRTAEDPRWTAVVFSLVAGTLMGLLIFGAARTVPERDDYRGRGSTDLRKAFGDILRNPHGRILLIVYGIETLGAASIGVMAPYLMQYVVHAPEMTEVFIVTYFIPQFALTPVWVWLGRFFSKRSMWLFSMVALAMGHFSIFFVGEQSFLLLFFIIFLMGLGGGCAQIVAPSIQADVIDYDEYLTGERKEGSYTSIWNLVRKSAAGIAIGLSGLALQWAGYVPNAEDQTDLVKTSLLAMMGLLPAACYVIGALIFSRFSLNEAEHQRIVKVLRDRTSA